MHDWISTNHDTKCENLSNDAWGVQLDSKNTTRLLRDKYFRFVFCLHGPCEAIGDIKLCHICHQHMQSKAVYFHVSSFFNACLVSSSTNISLNNEIKLEHSFMCGVLKYSTHLSPGQNSHHLADDIFKCLSMNENFYFDSNSTEVCFKGSNWQASNIGSCNGLASH